MFSSHIYKENNEHDQTYFIIVVGTINFTKPPRETMVHLVLHPHGIAPTFLKLDWWSPGAGFIPIISTKGINQIKKGKL